VETERVDRRIGQQLVVGKEANECDLCSQPFAEEVWRCTFPGGAWLFLGGTQLERFRHWYLCDACYPQLGLQLALAALAALGGQP
jgi:hypothetical protein